MDVDIFKHTVSYWYKIQVVIEHLNTWKASFDKKCDMPLVYWTS